MHCDHRSLCLKFPAKHRALMNFLSNVLREEGGFEYKKSIVHAILALIQVGLCLCLCLWINLRWAVAKVAGCGAGDIWHRRHPQHSKRLLGVAARVSS